MDNERRFLNRVEVTDFPKLMTQVCDDYSIGTYSSHSVCPLGYEDLNLILETNKGKFFAKLFGDFRTLEDCQRYIGVVEKALEAGVNHPALYKTPQDYLDQIKQDDKDVRASVMEYVDGKTFFELGIKPNLEEGIDLVGQATKINSIDYHPPFVYDSWAVSNMTNEFEKKKDALEPENRETIAPIVEEFKRLAADSLPHALVHGDIISTNVMKDKNGKIYIIDFAVTNWYPRIQELAALACDLFFDPNDTKQSARNYDWLVKEYQRHIKLTPQELDALPVFVIATHAMHVICASYEKSRGNTEGENNNWLTQGRQGLKRSQGMI